MIFSKIKLMLKLKLLFSKVERMFEKIDSCFPCLGLGVVPGERSFFYENEQNDQERSYHSEKRTNA